METNLKTTEVNSDNMIIDWAFQALSRAKIYEIFSSCYLQELNTELINQVRNVLSKLTDSENSIKSFAEEVLSPDQMSQRYYDRLFVPFSGKYVPPIESAVRGEVPANSKHGFASISSAESREVRLCFEAVGFDPMELNMFEPLKGMQFYDHMGFELAFMAYLCYAEEHAWRLQDPEKAVQWRRLQNQFLSQHLARWSKRYAELLEVRDMDFYSNVAHQAANWIADDLMETSNSPAMQ